MNPNLNTPGVATVDAPRKPGINHGPVKPLAGGRKVSASMRMPVLPQNWAYLRALRQAELEAWNAPRQVSLGRPSLLPRIVAQAAQPDSSERALYALVASVATAAVTYGLWNSFQLTEHWNGFVQLVRQILG